MEEKTYKFRAGYGWKIEPEVAGKVIEKIAEENNNEVTPHMVVAEAKRKSSPLHDLFDWDDKKAGDRWRLWQARSLIGSLVIEINMKEPEEVRAFVNIALPEQGNAYCSIMTIIDDEEKMKLVIAKEVERLKICSKNLKSFDKLKKYACKVDELVLELAS